MTDIDEQGGSPCIVVSSASGDVVDTWGAVKMLRRLCKIKRLRLRSPIVNAHPDPFYDNVNHQLIGVLLSPVNLLSYGHKGNCQSHQF
jgi:hypothetical protein